MGRATATQAGVEAGWHAAWVATSSLTNPLAAPADTPEPNEADEEAPVGTRTALVVDLVDAVWAKAPAWPEDGPTPDIVDALEVVVPVTSGTVSSRAPCDAGYGL